jgi:hypothetical protein
MSKPTVFAGVALALCASTAFAQPTEAPDEAAKKLTPYVYMRDAGGNKVFIESVFWRNDPNYDARSLKRMSDLMAAFEKLGFKGNPDAANGWDKPEKVVRCRINMEVVNKRWRGKSGAIVNCENTGISEAEVAGSEDPKHVSLILDAFNKQFKLAKERLAR